MPYTEKLCPVNPGNCPTGQRTDAGGSSAGLAGAGEGTEIFGMKGRAEFAGERGAGG
jgi:hypothetical protein